MKEDKKLMCISFSGGRTSAMMTKYLIDNKSDEYDFIVVFSNTGHEREETLKFVDNCDKHFGFNTVWIEPVVNHVSKKGTTHKIVNFNTAYRNVLKNGIDPFEEMIKKYGIPNIMNPHCSRELKKSPIRSFMRDVFEKRKYITALGIRSDEPKRLDWHKAYKENLMYFAQFGHITKSIVNSFWSKQSFDLKLKSYEGNCTLCWKKSDRKLYTIIQQGLQSDDKEVLAEISWLNEMQVKYGEFVPESRKQKQHGTSYFFREHRTIIDVLEESSDISFLEFATDESHIIDDIIQLSLWDNKLDMNGGCVESCEAF